MGNAILNDEDLKRKAPSVFALEAWQERSEKYRFIPTISIVNALRESGYYPVKAVQSRTRIEGKAEYTKHMLRFRCISPTSGEVSHAVNDIIPEIVLINSHDGSSAYKMMLGLFRLVCSNGLVVADKELASISVRHSGQHNLIREVIDVSGWLINEAPKSLEKANQWSGILLSAPEQIAFAESAKELYASTIDIPTERLLRARRYADNAGTDGSRDLWKTYNAIQENIIKGGVMGRDTKGGYRHTRETKSVDRDVKLNRALWTLTEKMASLKA